MTYNPPAGLIKELIAEAEEKGWTSVLKHLFSSAPGETEELKTIILDKRQAFWKLLVSLPPQGRVLVLGDPWGSTTLGLASLCHEITCLDLDPNRLRLVSLRAKEEGITNAKFITGVSLPFSLPDATFDLLVINGSLTYFAAQSAGKDSNTYQEILREAHRLLKPNGCLYLGADNRWGYQRKHNHPCCSFNGYKKLLAQSGFNEIKFFCPVPNYRMFNYIMPLEDKNVINHWIKHRNTTTLRKKAGVLLTQTLIRLGLLKHLVPSFSIVCYK